jgi:hypothetical protein
MDAVLKKVCYDPEHSAGYGSVTALYNVVKHFGLS